MNNLRLHIGLANLNGARVLLLWKIQDSSAPGGTSSAGIVAITIFGADSWVYIEMFGRSKEEWFKTFLELPGGIPSHDTPAFAGVASSAKYSPVWTPSNSKAVSWAGLRR